MYVMPTKGQNIIEIWLRWTVKSSVIKTMVKSNKFKMKLEETYI